MRRHAALVGKSPSSGDSGILAFVAVMTVIVFRPCFIRCAVVAETEVAFSRETWVTGKDSGLRRLHMGEKKPAQP